MSNSLQPHELQHASLPCPSLFTRVYSHSCPLSQWCYPIISSSDTFFSFCLQSFPASGSFSMSQLFASGSPSTVALASASVLPMSIQDWFPLGLTGWISLQSKGLSRVFSSNGGQNASACTAIYKIPLSNCLSKNRTLYLALITTHNPQRQEEADGGSHGSHRILWGDSWTCMALGTWERWASSPDTQLLLLKHCHISPKLLQQLPISATVLQFHLHTAGKRILSYPTPVSNILPLHLKFN